MYKTRHAFNYLLRKESVANDVINVDYHCLLTTKLRWKLKMLTKEDKILTKNVWESKKYGVMRLIEEFSNKKWSKRGVEDFLKRLRSTRSIERAPDGRCEPRHRRVEASSVSLCRRWRQTFWALLMIAIYSQNNNVKMATVNVIIGDDFFCSLLLWS